MTIETDKLIITEGAFSYNILIEALFAGTQGEECPTHMLVSEETSKRICKKFEQQKFLPGKFGRADIVATVGVPNNLIVVSRPGRTLGKDVVIILVD